MRRSNLELCSEILQGLRELKDEISKLTPDPSNGPTFGELAREWLKRIRRVDGGANEKNHVRHLAPLAELREGELTKAEIDKVFVGLCDAGKLGPATINKLRSTGRLIIDDALANGDWERANPFNLVRRMRESRPVYRTLSLYEAVLVVRQFPVQHQALVLTILLVGMRPGEAFALQKVDVDLAARIIIIRRSHGRDETKTGRERTAPIPRALVRVLRQAMRESGCELVFPKPGTTQRRSPNSRMSERMRVAMKRAGIVTGWRFRCRKYACTFAKELVRERRVQLPCPKCREPMWSVGIPKKLRFYDLRHTSATLHREAKCDPLVIQEMLGHSPRNTTDLTYTHLTDAYRRREVNKLKLG